MSFYEKIPEDIHHYIFNDIYLYELLNMYKNPASKNIHYMLETYGIGKLLEMIKTHIVDKKFAYVLRGSDLTVILHSNINSSADLIEAFLKKNIILSVVGNVVSIVYLNKGIERILYINHNGTFQSEEWKLNGQFHRTDAPAIQKWNSSGIKSDYWYENDQLHRIGNPAVIERNHTGVKKEGWYKNGLLHRIGLPAVTEWYDNRNIKSESYYENNQLHRIGKPALITRSSKGKTEYEAWYTNGHMQKEIIH